MRNGGKGQAAANEAPPAEGESPANVAASSLPDSSLRSTTIAASLPSSDGSACMRTPSIFAREVPWHELHLGEQIQPYQNYAHCVGDVHLLARFLELTELPDIQGDSVKLLFRTLKFLRLCDYTVEDICSILAHTSSYFLDAWTLCGNQMDGSEVGNVLATLTYVAHCYVQDETCPLHIWHQHLFRKYCPLKTLNAAVIRLMQIRRYVLRLTSDDLNYRFGRLKDALDRMRVQPTTDDTGLTSESETPSLPRHES
mmetsp:Transcript_5011/g.12222  ORF Transcript_5011/g.12222 Transcript_5011/m.12222 type:complete len:255 (-) Transcript_5011:72-836(-)